MGLQMGDLYPDNNRQLAEYWQPRSPDPVNEAPTCEQRAKIAALWDETQLLTDQAVAYLRSRRIAADAADSNGVRSHRNWLGGGPAIIFPATNPAGELVALQGRYIDSKGGDKFMSMGPKSLGAYATDCAWSHEMVAITEAPFDALSLAVCGLPSVALMGSSAKGWLASSLNRLRCKVKCLLISKGTTTQAPEGLQFEPPPKAAPETNTRLLREVAHAIRAHARRIESDCGNTDQYEAEKPVVEELMRVAAAVERFEPPAGRKAPRLRFPRR